MRFLQTLYVVGFVGCSTQASLVADPKLGEIAAALKSSADWQSSKPIENFPGGVAIGLLTQSKGALVEFLPEQSGLTVSRNSVT